MKTNYDRSFELIIGHEGGFQDDRRDRGNWTSGTIGKGELRGTKFGITAMTYPDLPIKHLTIQQAKDIYYDDFWKPAGCDELPSGIDHLVFDAAVNHGKDRAVKLLQLSIGAVPDGAIGPRTRSRLASAKVSEVITEFCVRRAMFYAGIKTFNVYGLGWTRRAFKTCLEAHQFNETPLDQSKVEPQETVVDTDCVQLELFGLSLKVCKEN